MSRQLESVRIVDPLTVYLRFMGWTVENMHGSQYQDGIPDLYIMHSKYAPRWVECKRWLGDNLTSIHLTTAQKKKFPIWIANGVGIWVIVGNDFRGVGGKPELIKAYKKLFDPPNCHYALHHSNWRFLK